MASIPSMPFFNTKSPTVKRILQESRELLLSPDPSLTAAPLETNLFEWHFTLSGPPSTPYAGGVYHGRIVLPPSYPLRPPSFRFLTPSGRFEVNREICLSISGHHEETWQPAWGVRTALCAIRAFMESEAKGQVGGLDMNDAARRRLATESGGWKCGTCCEKSNREILDECTAAWQERHGAGADTKAPEGQIPEDLRLVYKDDLERTPLDAGGSPTQSEGRTKRSENEVDTDRDTADRPIPLATLHAVGQRETVKPPLEGAPISCSASGSQAIIGSGPHPTQPSLRASIATDPIASALRGPVARRTVVQSLAEEAVPGWVDKAILAVILGLILVLLKKTIVVL